MRIPLIETFGSVPWPKAARRVLPTASPQRAATALWGPVFAWCALRLIAESVDEKNIDQTALEVFDRLRLREPLGHAFNHLGIEGEDGWKAAGRARVLLLARSLMHKDAQAKASELEPRVLAAEKNVAKSPAETTPAVDAKSAGATQGGESGIEGFADALWRDADVRWLAGSAREGKDYVVRAVEELLWWLQIPELTRLGGLATPSRAGAESVRKQVEDALEAIEKGRYRVDKLVKKPVAEAPIMDARSEGSPKKGAEDKAGTAVAPEVPAVKRAVTAEDVPEADASKATTAETTSKRK